MVAVRRPFLSLWENGRAGGKRRRDATSRYEDNNRSIPFCVSFPLDPSDREHTYSRTRPGTASRSAPAAARKVHLLLTFVLSAWMLARRLVCYTWGPSQNTSCTAGAARSSSRTRSTYLGARNLFVRHVRCEQTWPPRKCQRSMPRAVCRPSATEMENEEAASRGPDAYHRPR